MKTKTPTTPKKPITGPLTDWRQPIFSESALRIMEQATGQRYARTTRPPVVEAPVTPAVDAD